MAARFPTGPGWYSDPHAKGYERYWDGAAWTAQSRPAVRRGWSGARMGVVAAVAALAVAGGILAVFAASRPVLDEQADLVERGSDRAYDTAASNDALRLGQKLRIYYVDHDGAPPRVSTASGRYEFAAGSGLSGKPISEGVVFGGATGTGPDSWCVWVTTDQATPRPWHYSAAGGPASGACP